ncbi:hypothetical protein QW71_24955 [Paenibacillus sp. IHB B 3415]|nr:hypothetical protein QW71_24955 [Paenibacillus sp. IHB B 3415]
MLMEKIVEVSLKSRRDEQMKSRSALESAVSEREEEMKSRSALEWREEEMKSRSALECAESRPDEQTRGINPSNSAGSRASLYKNKGPCQAAHSWRLAQPL